MDGQRDGQRLVDGRGEAARKVPLALLLSKRVCVECSVSRSGSASVCKLSRCQHGRVYLVTVRHTLKHRSALVGPAGLESRAWLVCHIANALRRSGRDEAREGANMTRSFWSWRLGRLTVWYHCQYRAVPYQLHRLSAVVIAVGSATG